MCSKLPKCMSASQCSDAALDKFETKCGETIKSLYNYRYHRCERPNFKLNSITWYPLLELKTYPNKKIVVLKCFC